MKKREILTGFLAPPGLSKAKLAKLRQREWDVLLLVTEGIDTTGIADRLCMTSKSVHNYRNRIASKLSLKGKGILGRFTSENRGELLAFYAMLQGIDSIMNVR